MGKTDHTGRGEADVQFLQVAVGDVVAAPVRDSVELDAVGELHLVLIVEPAALLGPLGCAARFFRFSVADLTSRLDVRVVDKLVLFFESFC